MIEIFRRKRFWTAAEEFDNLSRSGSRPILESFYLCRAVFRLLFVFTVVIGTVSAAAALPEPEKRIPENIVYMDAGQGIRYAVIVEKSSQQLFLYSYDGDGSYRIVYQMACSTGENPGAKSKAGDKRTPEGVYFFVKDHPDRDLAPIYGTRAFPIDYPNLIDRMSGKGGSAIWLHGTNKPLKKNDSNGCIVLENGNINKMAEYISLNRTPIIIQEKLRYRAVDKDLKVKAQLLDMVSRWQTALEQGPYHQYLAFYDPEYFPDMQWWPQWHKIRNSLDQAGMRYSIVQKKLSIYRHENSYMVLFDQNLKAGNGKRIHVGTRKLFFKEGENGIKITGDTFQLQPLQKAIPGHSLLAAKSLLEKPYDVKKEIAGMVEDWLKAWSSMNIRSYAGFYAFDFRSQGGANRKSWLAYKQRLNRKYEFIRVTHKNLKIDPKKNRATVSFTQTYACDQFKTTGTKRLILKREQGQWKIFRELWIKG